MRRRAVAGGHFRMAQYKDEKRISRRIFLRGMRWAPVLFVPAPLQAWPLGLKLAAPPRAIPPFPLADSRLTPHYPAKSPLDDLLRLVAPGSDEFVTEKYAFEIGRLLDGWSGGLRSSPPALDVLARFLDPSIESGLFGPAQEKTLRS